MFLTVPILIEMVMPIWTTIAIRLVVSLAIHAFEDIRTWLTNIGSRTIQFLVFNTAPCFLLVVFSIMSSIALGAPGDVRATTKYRMSPLPTVLTLRNPWVHVCSVNGHNVSSNVESLIDDVLRTRTTLRILDVYPYYCFI